jgi:hypothetical protein
MLEVYAPSVIPEVYEPSVIKPSIANMAKQSLKSSSFKICTPLLKLMDLPACIGERVVTL